MKVRVIAPVFIMIAAGLWAIDALFRTQLTFTIPPASIVFFEHVLGFIFVSPIFIKGISHYKSLSQKDWITVLLMTIVSSTLGTILFTEALKRSFAENDFVTPLLLQKMQPVFVVLLSAIFLKEKITFRFAILAVFALLGSYLISFGTYIPTFTLQNKEIVYLLALGATLCWGAGTILSKQVLKTLNFPQATALRFLVAIPVAFIFSLVLGQTYNFMTLSLEQMGRFLVIAGITGGAGALLLYYRGLQFTQAKVSTIAELMFPVVSIIIAVTTLNPYGKPQLLSLPNILGIILLLTSMLLVSFDAHVSEKKEASEK